MKKFASVILLLAVSMLSFAQGTANITSGIFSLCSFISNLLPVISALLVVGAGASYAGGQLMGAETRARANIWATGMITGALFGILISVAGPAILGAMYGPAWDSSCQQAGGGGPAQGEVCPNYAGGYCPQGEACLSGQYCCPQAQYCSNPNGPPPYPSCCLPGNLCCTKLFGVEVASCLAPDRYAQFCDD